MKFNVSSISNIKNKCLRKKIYYLNKYLLKQNEKVAYAYKNLSTDDMFSFNLDVCFYSASAIKFLVCLYIYEQAETNPEILENELILNPEDFKQGSGVLKNTPNKTNYSVKQLIYYALKESDNTAYIKLVNYVTAEKLKAYGLSLGAKHTLEGKDLFGIVNASDMLIYLKHSYDYFETNTKFSQELKNNMSNPSYKIIKSKNIDNNLFVRKYGGFGIAFHEVGIVYDENPYVLIILTQKNELKDKEKYINKVARKINKTHRLIKQYNIRK